MSSEISGNFESQVISLLIEIRDILCDRLNEPNDEWDDGAVVDLACTLVWRNADNLSHQRIADQLTTMTGRKVHREGLMRNKMFRPYQDLYKRLTSGSESSIRRGHKTDTGDVEAYD